MAALASLLLQQHLVLAQREGVDGGEQLGGRDGKGVAHLVHALFVQQHHVVAALGDLQQQPGEAQAHTLL